MKLKKNYEIEKELFEIIPTKNDLILLYKHKQKNKMDLHDTTTLLSLSMYVNILGKVSDNERKN